MDSSQSRASGAKRADDAVLEGDANVRSANLANLPPPGEVDEVEERWILLPQAGEGKYTGLARKHRPKAVAAVQCIHELAPSSCGLCSGYARWLIEDEGSEARLRWTRANPEAARREFRRSVAEKRGPASA